LLSEAGYHRSKGQETPRRAMEPQDDFDNPPPPPDPTGEYRPARWLLPVKLLGTLPVLLLGLVSGREVLAWRGDQSPLPEGSGPYLVAGIVCCALAVALLLLVSSLRRVRWDAQGVEFIGYSLSPRRYAWSEVTGSEVARRGATERVHLTTRDGHHFAFDPAGRNYHALLLALDQHVGRATAGEG
jgi:hypothetical protein